MPRSVDLADGLERSLAKLIGPSSVPMEEVMISSFGTLAAQIRARPSHGACQLIAVDGPSGAGKSTFAAQLARALGGALIVEMDDFVSWSDLDGWWPRLETQVLAPLLAGHAATYQQRDWDGDPAGNSLGSWKTVEPCSIVVLEGVTSSRREIADRLAFAVWVDAPRRTRLRRGIERDGAEMRAAWVDWMQREESFFAADGTVGRADLLVNGAPVVPTRVSEFSFDVRH